MLWYVAFISVLNLGLGYALAIYLGAPSRRDRIDEDTLPSWPGPVNPTPTRHQDATAETAAARLPDGAAVAPVADTTPPDETGELTGAEPAGSSSTAIMQPADDTPDLPAAPAPPVEQPPRDPVTQLVTRDYAERLLADFLAGGASPGWASAALVEVNWAGQVDGDAQERLLCGVVGTVRQMIGDGNTAARHGASPVASRYSDRQLLIVLPDSDADETTQLVEQLRQRVETTKYVADGVHHPITLTCALADVGGTPTFAALLDMLEEALAEARRYGGNRTFMHDGLSPTPVVPLDLELTVQQCVI